MGGESSTCDQRNDYARARLRKKSRRAVRGMERHLRYIHEALHGEIEFFSFKSRPRSCVRPSMCI